MISSGLRAVWSAPREPAPAGPPRVDLALAAVLASAAVVEGVARSDVPWPAYSIALAVVCALAIPLRRSRPLLALVVAYGAQTLAGVGPALAGLEYGVLNVTACVLLFPYSLCRWGSGRAAVVGVAFLLTCHLGREPLYGSSGVSILVGVGALLFPAALGASVRFFVRARSREAEQVRMHERGQLARELHDTVAHHVSGIVIQAQAGRAVAAADPATAVDVLRVIEEAATRTLAEMRSLVGILRADGEAAERAPVPGIADLPRFVRSQSGEPEVHLDVAGDLPDAGATADAAIYRIVQESVTNARRHARGATRVDVRVSAVEGDLRVEVVDDGAVPSGGRGEGYGLLGMAERVELLDGRFEAGERSGGGWAVTATIPSREESA